MAAYSVPQEATSLLRKLVTDPRLEIPQQVVDIAQDVQYVGSDLPLLPVPWKFTEAISALKGLEGAFAALLANERFAGEINPGQITIDCDHASLFVFSMVTTSVDGKSAADPSVLARLRDWDIHDSSKHPYRRLATNVYQTRDGKWFHLHGSLNAEPSQKMIGVDPSRIDITDTAQIVALYQEHVAKFDASELDTLANDKYRQAGTTCYTYEEFLELDQGKAISNIPIYELSAAESGIHSECQWPPATSNKALSGIKVLEISRIIAAPAIGRGLAEHGATVLRITSDALPDMHLLHPDLSQGKFQASLDLKSESGRKRMRELLADADVVIDGYRPGSMERLGFGPEAVRKIVGHREGRGIVYLRENAYGWHGPWVHRSGWQQISDCFTGISWGFGQKQGLDEAVVPIFPNSDYATGVIGVIGVMHALYLRSHQGGSFNLDVSLSYYNVWLAQQGFYPQDVWDKIKLATPVRHNEDLQIMLMKVVPIIIKARPDLFQRPDLWQIFEAPSFQGTIRTLAPVVQYSGNLEVGRERPPVQNGEDPAEWPANASAVAK